MSLNKYSVEYAKTARSLCKNSKCKSKIDKDELRIAKIYPSDRFEAGGTQTDWFHYNCIFDALSRARKDTKKIESEDDLEGFIGLADSDQELIRDCLNGKIPPPAGSSGKKGNSDESDSNTKKKKEKKPATIKPKAKKKENIFNSSDSESSETEVHIGIVKMKSTEGNKVTKFSSKENPHVIGRDSEELKGENARKVSRKQLELIVNDTNVILIRRGPNPSFLLSQSKNKTVAMDKDEKYEVRDGDVVSLFLQEFTYKFDIQEIEKKVEKKKKKPVKKDVKKVVEKKKEEKKEEKKPVKAKKEKSESTDSPKKKGKKKKNDSDEEDSGPDEYDVHDSFIDDEPVKKKKKQHNMDDDDFEAIQEGKAFAKAYGKQLKRKMGSDEDDSDDDKVNGKTKCKYGAKCYRENPEHVKQFWHPPKNGGKLQQEKRSQKKPKYKEEEEDDGDEEEDKPTLEMKGEAPLPPSKNKTPTKKEKKTDDVAQLQELFPDLSESKIKQVLEKHGDMNEAIDELSEL